MRLLLLQNFSNNPPEEKDTNFALNFSEDFAIESVSSVFPDILVATTRVFSSIFLEEDNPW